MDSRKFGTLSNQPPVRMLRCKTRLPPRNGSSIFIIDDGDTVTGIDVDAIGDSSVNLESVSSTLDEDITALEVRDAIRALKSNKAPRPDGLCGEFYKYSDACVVNFLTKYFKKQI